MTDLEKYQSELIESGTDYTRGEIVVINANGHDRLFDANGANVVLNSVKVVANLSEYD